MNLPLFAGGSTTLQTPPVAFQSLPVTPPGPHDGDGLLPVTFDGRRRGTKHLD